MSLALLAAGALTAAPPDRLSYQGVLRNATGAAQNGSYDMVFRFFDAATAGNEILVNRHEGTGTGSVVVSNGLFQVEVGSGVMIDGSALLPGDPYTTLAAVFEDFGDVWLEIAVGQGGSFETLSPRTHVVSAPYALYAESANTVGGVPAGNFLTTSAIAQTKAGGLQVDGTLTAGGNLIGFGLGGTLESNASRMIITGGNANSDDLYLRGGNGAGDGAIEVLGAGPINLRAGSGAVNFMNDATSATTATLDAGGNFISAGDLAAGGNDITFGSAGARIAVTDTEMNIIGGDGTNGVIRLQATGNYLDGGVVVNGQSSLSLWSGNGTIFFAAPPMGQMAALQDGNLYLDGELIARGLIASGSLALGETGGTPLVTGIDFNEHSSVTYDSLHTLDVIAGPHSQDILNLDAGSSSIRIIGDNQIYMRPNNGKVTFQAGAATTAEVTAAGLFSANELAALSNRIHMGIPGSTYLERNPGNDHLLIARDQDFNHTDSQFRIYTGTTVPILQMLIGDGDEAATFFDGAANANGIDYAEAFLISDSTLAAGDVVVFDTSSSGFVSRSDQAYSTLIAGVISTRPGFVTGNSFNAEEAADPVLADQMRAAEAAGDFNRAAELSTALRQLKEARQRPVALAGRLPVKVDATYGPIKAGDHLTSSKTPGHAMAMAEPGPSLGVALEGWDGPGTGVIMAFVQRGHYTPPALLAQTVASQQSLATSLAFRTPDPVSGAQMMPSNLQVVLDAQGGEDARFSIFRDGSASEPRAEMFRVDERGNVWAQGAIRPRAMDLAEMFALSEPVEPGDVLVADRKNPGLYARSSLMGDPAVVGVVASDPGVILGADMTRLLAAQPDLTEALAAARAANDRATEQSVWAELEKRFHATHAAVALSGTLRVKVDADYGAIQPGDLLMASPIPGHAMRAPSPAPEGAVIGKALESFDAGAGVIRMIVALR